MMSPRIWKGKGRAQAAYLSRQDADETNGEAGIVIPMTLIDNSAYDAVYTISMLVGPNKQNLSLQVDTGSSDLWIASTSCSSSTCGQASGHLYDPSQSTPTNIEFSITYVEGQVSGPIVWDTVQLGSYVIDNQALAAASSVTSEPLSYAFSGILGLALPLNSYIATMLPPVTGNNPDGAAFSSNLFSITPTSAAPSSRFFSISLERPESDTIPSLLGIGKHPPDLISDPSKVLYAPLVQESAGAFFWKTSVKAITIYVDGQPKPINVARNDGAGGRASAVIDSGMPIILTSVAIANGIYGALGIGPAADGQYYIPCTTPINMTISLDDRPEIPLHPLDLTTYPPSTSSSSSSCIGIIQSYPIGSSVSSVAEIILGVPFMRSTYTVLAYDQPDSFGNFPNATSPTGSPSYMNMIRPRLGLLGLTNSTVALDEFNTVRVLNQPLTKSGSGAQSGGTAGGTLGTSGGGGGGKRLSVGVEVLIGLVGFFALCFILFGARWAYMRRRLSRDGLGGGLPTAGSSGSLKSRDEYLMQDVDHRLARRRGSGDDRYGPSEDALREMRFSEYLKKKDEVRSEYTDDSGRTRVGFGPVREHNDLGLGLGLGVDDEHEDEHEGGVEGGRRKGENGYAPVKTHIRSDSEGSGSSLDVDGGGGAQNHPPLSPGFVAGARDSDNDGWTRRSLLSQNRQTFVEDPTTTVPPPRSITTNSIPDEYLNLSTSTPTSRTFPRTNDNDNDPLQSRHQQYHQRTPSGEPSVAMPLLAHTRSDSYISKLDDDFGSFILANHFGSPPTTTTISGGSGDRASMAGVGTLGARRSSGFSIRMGSHHQPPSIRPMSPRRVSSSGSGSVGVGEVIVEDDPLRLSSPPMGDQFLPMSLTETSPPLPPSLPPPLSLSPSSPPPPPPMQASLPLPVLLNKDSSKESLTTNGHGS